MFYCKQCHHYNPSRWLCLKCGKKRMPGDRADRCPFFRTVIKGEVLDCGAN